MKLLSMLLLSVMLITGCGKAPSLTAPTPTEINPGPGTHSNTMSMTFQPQQDINLLAPATDDSLFIVWGATWQSKTFVGFLTTDGHIDRNYTAQIAGGGETHQLRFVFRHNDAFYPAYGSFGINNVPLTAIDQTEFTIWYTFRANRDANGSLVIDPIRNDMPMMQTSEVWVTGIDTPAGSHDRPSTGDQNMKFASTTDNLVGTPGVFDNNTWKSFIWTKRGQPILLLPLNGTTGELARAGVYLKSADGSMVLLKNFKDLDPRDNNYYPAYMATLDGNGQWANPFPNRDDRWSDIIIR